MNDPKVFSHSIQSSFWIQIEKMFIKKFNEIILRDFIFYCKSRQFSKNFCRAVSTSHNKFNSNQDFIVKSPLKSLVYPDCSVDQYVWSDINKWNNKIAIVS